MSAPPAIRLASVTSQGSPSPIHEAMVSLGTESEEMVSHEVPNWNQLVECLRGLESLRAVGRDAPWNCCVAF